MPEQTKMRWTTTPLMLLAILCTTTILAEGWPKWLGPEGNGISTETGLVESWPEAGPKKLWEHKVGIGYSSPIALDGKIYFFGQEGSKDTLFAFDESGKVLWSESYSRGGDPAYPGTRATPTIENGRIYTHGSNGDLVCRELADGKLVWQINVLKLTNAKPIEWGQASSPLIIGDHIFVQSGKEGDATAVCVDKTDGKIVWKSEAKLPAGYTTIVVMPVGDQSHLVVLAQDTLIGMDPKTGKTIWKEPWKASYDVNATTPVFRGDNVLVTSTRSNNGAMMMSITPQGAKKLWEKKEVSSKFQPPILEGDALYANNNGVLTCVGWPAFNVLWVAKGRDLNLGAGGSIVRTGDKLITMSERGKLSLIQATPKEYKLISQVQLFDYAQVWSTPLIYRGKLYCKGETDLVCLDISKK